MTGVSKTILDSNRAIPMAKAALCDSDSRCRDSGDSRACGLRLRNRAIRDSVPLRL